MQSVGSMVIVPSSSSSSSSKVGAAAGSEKTNVPERVCVMGKESVVSCVCGVRMSK